MIGTGCVVHIPSFFAELSSLQAKGLATSGRIFVSDGAHVVFDLHQLIDGLQEAALGKSKVGTTGKGIGPCYSTKAARTGVRVGQLVRDKAGTDTRLRDLAKVNRLTYGELMGKYDVEEEIRKIDGLREQLAPYVVDGVTMFTEAQASGQEILIEGSQALLLDVNYGTYPFVTSSECGIAGCFSGLGGLKRRRIREVIGVVKAYTSRVGKGPFPTEQINADGTENEIGRRLQHAGEEFGTTTGRRRRCGWLDAVALRHSCEVNDYDALNLTKLDVLDGFPEIKVAVAYRVKEKKGAAAGQEASLLLKRFPSDVSVLEADGFEVEYKTFEGWMASTKGVTSWDALPDRARAYILWIEEFLAVRVMYIGTGPKREDMISR